MRWGRGTCIRGGTGHRRAACLTRVPCCCVPSAEACLLSAACSSRVTQPSVGASGRIHQDATSVIRDCHCPLAGPAGLYDCSARAGRPRLQPREPAQNRRSVWVLISVQWVDRHCSNTVRHVNQCSFESMAGPSTPMASGAGSLMRSAGCRGVPARGGEGDASPAGAFEASWQLGGRGGDAEACIASWLCQDAPVVLVCRW